MKNGEEKNLIRFFLQWPDFVRRNGAALGWRPGMVQKFSTERSLYYSSLLIQASNN